METGKIINIIVISVIVIIFLIVAFYSFDLFVFNRPDKQATTVSTSTSTSTTHVFSYTPEDFVYVDENGKETLHRGIIPSSNTNIPKNYLLYF